MPKPRNTFSVHVVMGIVPELMKRVDDPATQQSPGEAMDEVGHVVEGYWLHGVCGRLREGVESLAPRHRAASKSIWR